MAGLHGALLFHCSSSASPQRSASPLSITSRTSSSPGRTGSGGAVGGASGEQGEPIKGHFSIGVSSPKEDIRFVLALLISC